MVNKIEDRLLRYNAYIQKKSPELPLPVLQPYVVIRQFPVQKCDLSHIHPSTRPRVSVTLQYKAFVLVATLLQRLDSFSSPQLAVPLRLEKLEAERTNRVNLMPPGHESKVIIEHPPRPDEWCSESGELLDSFLKLVHS